jgi:hypothetical protein
MNGKFNDMGNADLVIKYLCIHIQNIKMNKKSLYSLHDKAIYIKKDNTYIYSR